MTESYKSIVISQPMLMPWRGMFEQIKLSDSFVFYDDVQLPLGRSLITRVQIKSQDGFRWLSLPVRRANQGKQLISEAVFAHQNWRQQHLELIRQCYRKSAYFEETFELVVRPIYEFQSESVSDFCINSTILVANKLGLNRDWKVSSRVIKSCNSDASDRLLELCKKIGASRYITGLGAINYINYDLFEKSNVNIEYMQYRLTPYPQIHGAFNPYVSVIDLLFNTGSKAIDFLDSESLYWKSFIDLPENQKRNMVVFE